jgi:hypothetical protein
MTRPVDKILEGIKQFEPDDGNWLELDGLLEELWETSEPERGIDVMLGVLERFPEEDGAGVLWSIVHGLESLSDYEDKLVESIWRQPSHIGLVMISRIVNTGVDVVGSKPITAILEHVLQHEKVTPDLRKQAETIKGRINNRL